MKIKCPSCHASYNINEAKLPDQGASVGCLKCKHQFFIEKPQVLPKAETKGIIEKKLFESKTKTDGNMCPRCNLPQKGIDECEYCGYSFNQSIKKEKQNTIYKTPAIHRKFLNRKRIIVAAAALLILVVGIAFYLTPHWTIYKMRKAAINKDPDKLSVYIDFPELRKSLKANFNAVMANQISKTSSGSPFEIMGAALATKFTERLVEIFVTPESLSKLMQGEKPSIKESGKSVKSSSPKKERVVDMSASYESFNRFNFSIREKESTAKPVDFILRREGILSWKLISIKLPMGKDEMIAKSKPKSTLASSSSGKTEVQEPRFIDNEDGTVTDNLTGLMWTIDAMHISDKKNWLDGIEACKNLEFAGWDDWRMPNVKEMLSLIDYGYYDPALTPDNPFVNVPGYPGVYWSSTTLAVNNDAFHVPISNGTVNHVGKAELKYIWPVRGGN